MRTLVVGATGLLGLEVCRRLREAAHPVRALVRPSSEASKREALRALGAELVEGDLKDPASLARACAGVEAVVSTASATMSRQAGDSVGSVDREGQIALVDAARDAGVRHFVFVSFRKPSGFDYPLSDAKRAVEARLQASGMAYTILLASYFMEVWLTPALGFDPATAVRLYGTGERPLSWVSFRDVARVAAAAIDQPQARNQVVEVGGPQALSQRDVVRIVEGRSGRPVQTETVAEADLRAQLRGAREPLQQTFAGLMLQCALGDAMDTRAAERLFPFPRTSVQDFLSQR